MTKKRKSFSIYLDWENQIKLLSPEEVKLMLLSMMEFYDGGVEPEIDDKYPMLKMFFADKFQYMKRLEEDRIDKLEKYRGSKEAPRSSKEAVNVGVDVEVDVDVPVPVSINVPDSRLGERLSESEKTPSPTPDSPEFKSLSRKIQEKILDEAFADI